ncbi:hypothetical protein J7L67_04445 [bacterium]|nr:hypothetical protein [bacterium]
MKKFVFFFLIFLCCSSGFAKTSGYTEIINESSNLNLNIVSSVEGKSDKLILFIEDAHCNYIAQKEISSIVEHMMDSGQFGLIAVEGSEGEILTHFFSTFPIEKIRKKYSDKLLKNGLISGEEYFAVQSGNPVRIYGVDDRDVYERNINKFRDFFSLYGSSSDAVDKLKYGFFCIKQENYNDFLFEFEKKCIAFKKKTINLEQLIDYCAVHIIDYYVLLKNYDELSKLNDVISKQENFDYKLLDNQTRKITAYINKNSPKEVSRKCKALVFNHLTGKIKSVVFYKKLYSFAKENMPDNPEIYSYLTKYIEIADAVSGLNYKQLNMELNGFINDCYSTLIKGAKEKKIFKLSKEFEIYENIFNLTLTRTEYNSWLGLAEDKNSFAQFIEKYNKLSKNEPLSNDDRALLNNLFENNISFYRVADERDSILFENTCKVIKSENLNNVILIAGGFHSLRIFEECRKNDISCIVIRPRNVGDNDFKQYAKVLLREDLFSKKTGALNYPDKLRATSFFAEYSFDDINRINEFRNEFIFNAVIDSLEKFSYSEIFEVVKAWRNGFEKAVRLRYPDDTGHMRQSLDMFDYMVTDVFSFGNIEIDPQNRSIVVSTAGKSIKITKEPDSSVSIDTVSEVSKLEKNMGLKTDPIDLKNSQVFISSWTIDDPQSEYLGHGDAHYSVKYIEALNLRGIEPVVILPDDHGELNRTLEKYLSAVKGLNLKFKFAVYDNGYYIALDSSGIPVSRLNIVSNKKPVIIQLCSKIDRKNSDRMRVLNDRFKELTDTVAEPVIVRIPAAGTQVGDMDANHFDLYLTPAPAGTPPRHSIQTGFMVDEDLLEVVKDLKKRGKDFVRNRIITAVSQFSGGRLETVLKSLYGFEIDKITSMNWTFRYLTEKSDAELSSFMKALSVKKENQVVFTFYSDKPQKDMNHKKFLQRFFKFIDLQQADNDRLDTDSNILVINLPPLQSDVFKRLMASSDSAVVSGENSLMEGLIFNKLGVGPTLLFKPAMMDHLSILSNPISSTGRRGLLNKIENYVKLTDLPEIDYFGSYSANSGLDETQRFIYNVIFDPRANTLIRSVFASIVPSVNGLNALTDIIDEIDKKVPADTIVKSHNLTVEAHAAELVDEFFIDDNFDFNSPDNQLKFIETKLKPYVRGLLIDLVKMNLNSHDMKQLVSNFTDDIF